MSIAACGVCTGTTGSWTLKKTSDSYSPFATASNWLDGYVPTNAHDSMEFAVTSDNTNDRSWTWNAGGTGAIFGNVSELLDSPAAYEKMSKAVNPYGDGLACGRIVKALK